MTYRTTAVYISAFFRGMREFRCAMTTSYDDASTSRAYDKGREIAHRFTLRRFED